MTTTQVKMKNTSKKKKIASLDKRKARGGWIFVLPFVIGFILIYLPIVIDSLKYSFCTMEVSKGGELPTFTFVGWANYGDALIGKAVSGNASFIQKLIEGLSNMIFDIPMILIFSLFMAVLLNQKMAGRAVFRAIFFVPVILATGLMEPLLAEGIEAADSSGLDDGTGREGADSLTMVVENMMSNMAVGQGLVDYVVTVISNIADIINRSGVQMLIFLAGLQSISPAIYESVQIDGATAWETFWKITLPMISPMILVNGVYTIIDSFTREKNVVMSFIQSVSGEHGDAIGSAMSWMYFLVVVLIIAIVVGIMSAFVFYQKKD
ncbi:MAG: sugar ABC transporter permease [Clostridia bacterium]|nr:sugar ABC transporter permease [Clostridia bacterium]